LELDELRSELNKSRGAHAQSVAWASKYVKGILVVGGAAVAGFAQFWTWPAGGTPDVAQVTGIAATLVVALGGFYVLATEKDAADAIGVAEKAIDQAQALESRFDEVDEFFDAFARMAQTYQLALTMRGAIEQSAVGAAGGIDGLVTTLFTLAARPLQIAIAFAQADRWTLGVYKAVPSKMANKAELKCIAQKRAIECNIDESRVWPEGVGIAGIAYLNAREIVLPDLQAEGMRAIFGPKGHTREYDAERYVSMVAVPIKVVGQDRPWGVVVATSDRAGHFSAESSPGLKTDEPVRTLAAFIALAVAMGEARDRARSAPVSTVTTGSSEPRQEGQDGR
jgi:hypothetical protein